MKFLCRTIIVIAIGVVWPGLPHAAAEGDKHLGVASCARSVCHGKSLPQEDKNVLLNEYKTWSGPLDRHSDAFSTLRSRESRQIAAKLGLPSATTAKICLDCHTDNIPKSLQGPRFQHSDGIGCEACHGGAERWITSHTEAGVTHADNLTAGMTRTESPGSRARLCLSCHLGTKDQFATHMIMGAGHPRLRFELVSFTENQPSHYKVDEDYIQRKGQVSGFRMWLAGQVESARSYLTLVQSDLFDPPGIMPEFSLYDCHSCHHAMDDKRWSQSRAGAGVKPGSLRLQSQHLVVLQAVGEVLESADASQMILSATNELVRSGYTSTSAARQAAAQALTLIDQRTNVWADVSVTNKTISDVRRKLLQYSAAGRATDFNAAEQVFLSVETLSYMLGDYARHEASLNKMYEAVERSSSYRPDTFIRVAQNIQGRF